MTNRKTIIALALAVLFIASAVSLPGSTQGNPVNWQGTDGAFSANYSPQTQVGLTNVDTLQVKWIFPIATAPAGSQGIAGTTTPPIIYDGLAYFLTNWNRVYALDAASGKQLWSKDLPLKIQALAGQYGPAGHYHQMGGFSTRIKNTPILWLGLYGWQVYGLNALTGDILSNFTLGFSGGKVPGNYGRYDTTETTLLIDENAGVVAGGVSASEGADGGRGFIQAWDVNGNSPMKLWTVFIVPPQDGNDPNWSLNSVANMSHAWIFHGGKGIDLKTMASDQLKTLLYADWGDFGFNGTVSFAGAGLGWGGAWVVDPATDIGYIGTAQAGPDLNASTRPGPNLWADSIMALNLKTGKWVWGFQAFPHDLYDWDCSWSVALANATISGQTHKTIFKACKTGYLYALDAATGALLWSVKGDVHYSHWMLGADGQPGMDPSSPANMKQPWMDYPNLHSTLGLSFYRYSTGASEGNVAYDPVKNMVYFTTQQIPSEITIGPVKGKGVPYRGNVGGTLAGPFAGSLNATIYGVDGSTGTVKWTYFMDGIGHRGGISTSNGVVYVATVDGQLRMLDGSTGRLLNSKFLGGAPVMPPSIASDAGGKTILIQSVDCTLCTGASISPTPGYVVGLQASPPQQVTATREVTQTVTTSIVSTTGIDPAVFYATAAVAVVFLVATAAITVRRRGR